MVFDSLYLRRYLSDRKVLGQFRYVLVLNRSKITLTDPADTMGTPVTSQAVYSFFSLTNSLIVLRKIFEVLRKFLEM